MFTLQLLPKLFHRSSVSPTPISSNPSKTQKSSLNAKQSTASNAVSSWFSFSMPSEPTGARETPKANQDEVKQLVTVLEEQETQLQSFIRLAAEKRHFDDVQSLQRNLAEVQHALREARQQL
jgi:hypothetical protein